MWLAQWTDGLQAESRVVTRQVIVRKGWLVTPSTSVKHRAVFLDRDGVLNHTVLRDGSPFPPSDLRELVVPDGVDAGCKALREAGYLLIGISNQPDVVRGNIQRHAVDEINRYLMDRLGIESFWVCFHDDRDQCECRKPKPGLILRAADDLQIDLSRSFMIGDRWRDVEAGARAGCTTLLIDNRFAHAERCAPCYTVKDFNAAVDAIFNRERG